LLLAFIVLVCVWGFYARRFRNNLMGLQHMITASITVALVESMLWSMDYVLYNSGGRISDAINVIGTLFMTAKLTIIRTLILLVALGYSITTPILERQTKIFVLALTVAYGICIGVYEYLWVLSSMGVEISTLVQVLVLGVVSGLNVVYLVWITRSLVFHFRSLEQLKQTAKLAMYRKFSIFFGGFISISIIFFLLEFSLVAADLSDDLWRIWWVWDGYWEIGYFLVVLLVAYLWWPNENNERYAYSVQIGADGAATDELSNIGLDSSEEEQDKHNGESATTIKRNGYPDDDLDSDSGEDKDDDQL